MRSGSALAGRYELADLLGQGGMGEVFRAYDRVLEREVAVKLLPAHLLGDEASVRRFRREAQLAAALTHPNIVMVHDVVEDGGAQAIVMELVDGPTLARRVEVDGPMHWREALSTVAAVADGLHAAHQRGLVHRDIKPSNVLIAPDGTVKVTDFGIARAAAGSRTATATVQGSAPYIAPEQALGEPTDARTDLYSMGCVLYELLTGRPPYVSEDAVAIVYQHLHRTPEPPSAIVPTIPPGVDRYLHRLLARDPEDRPVSGAVAAGEARWLVDEDGTELPPPPVAATVIDVGGPDHTAVLPDPPPGTPPAADALPAGRRRRAGIGPVLVIAGLIALLVVVLMSGLADDPAPASAPEPAPTTPTPTPTPTTPTPTPTPTPTATEGGDGEASVAVRTATGTIRSAIRTGRLGGVIDESTADALDEELDAIEEASAAGDREEAEERVDTLQDGLETIIDSGEVPPGIARTLRTMLDALELAVRTS